MPWEREDEIGTGEAAALLGVHPGTLRRWCERGEVPHWTTPTGHRRFKRSELEAWLADRKGHTE